MEKMSWWFRGERLNCRSLTAINQNINYKGSAPSIGEFRNLDTVFFLSFIISFEVNSIFFWLCVFPFILTYRLQILVFVDRSRYFVRRIYD